ncbi:MAG: modified peptide precursor CbpA [Acidimicrobiales bacterium]
MTSVSARPEVVAYRKACRPTGIGLSHYVLVTNTAPRKDAPDKTNVR